MRQKFSLLELLVVLVALLVLAATLFIVIAQPREKAKRTNCWGNLRSLGKVMLMYSGENSGFFMLSPDGTNFEPLNTDQLCADGNVYGCPSARERRSTAAHSNYVYVGSGLRDDNVSARTVTLVYDQSGNHPNNGWMNALFIDGHVEGARPDGSKGWNCN